MTFSKLADRCPWGYKGDIQDMGSVGQRILCDRRLCTSTKKLCEDSNCGLLHLLSTTDSSKKEAN